MKTDVKVNVYGSSLSGFGFQDSDVNLSIEAPEGCIPSKVLVMACEALIPGGKSFKNLSYTEHIGNLKTKKENQPQTFSFLSS